MEDVKFNEEMMRRAIKLAKKGIGKVSPNPRVGAVIVKDGKVISEGWHHEFGKKHAEIDAIDKAKGVDLEGAEIYVNLEPCVHTGKTPPCTPALIEKRFSKVYVGMKDPNPLVAGKGIQKLKDNGIEVITDLCNTEAKWINRFFIKHIKTGIPYVIMKVAQSINGCIATSFGESKWITCETSRKRSHKIRAEVDGIIIGKRTAAVDNPSLTVRDVEGITPKRIIFDTNLSIPLNIKLFQDDDREKTIICCNFEATKTRKAENLRMVGVNVMPIMVSNEKHNIDIENALLRLSNDYSISSVLVEGGAAIFSSFIATPFVDELHIFIAPMIIGSGLNAFNFYNTDFLKKTKKFSVKAYSQSGDDIHIVALKNNS
jgi:diaminohydroxyphosphoribosylaminopyrimidine deaminase/5-amino-6-(5-phosphoribosylamino)uracil reductase